MDVAYWGMPMREIEWIGKIEWLSELSGLGEMEIGFKWIYESDTLILSFMLVRGRLWLGKLSMWGISHLDSDFTFLWVFGFGWVVGMWKLGFWGNCLRLLMWLLCLLKFLNVWYNFLGLIFWWDWGWFIYLGSEDWFMNSSNTGSGFFKEFIDSKMLSWKATCISRSSWVNKPA